MEVKRFTLNNTSKKRGGKNETKRNHLAELALESFFIFFFGGGGKWSLPNEKKKYFMKLEPKMATKSIENNKLFQNASLSIKNNEQQRANLKF